MSRLALFINDLLQNDKTSFHINYHGFWPCARKDFLNLSFVKALPCEKVECSYFHTDIDFYSIFSKDALKVPKKKKSIRVFFTGEDVEIRYPDFKSCYFDNTNMDLSLGFSYEDTINSDNYLRYPLWMCYYFGFTLDKDKIKKEVDWFNSLKNNGSDCALVASHDDMGIRTKMFDFIQKSGISCYFHGAFCVMISKSVKESEMVPEKSEIRKGEEK